MRKMKKIAATTLAAIMVASVSMGTTQAWARSSKRAAWNNAAAESSDTEMPVKDAYFVEDGSETEEHNVKSNVYANSTEWSAWKTEWETVRTEFCQIALTPGENETKLNAAWYSLKEETPMIKLINTATGTEKLYEGTQGTDVETVKEDDTTYNLIPCKVTITDLKENTSYKYQYYVNGAWSESYDYKTQSTDSFSVMYVGDPQIGASTNQLGNQTKEYYAMNDSYNWYHTLNNAVKANPNLSFILSAGDQINQTGVGSDAEKLQQQIEYAGFLHSSVLRSLPIATTIGNHDSKSVNYSNHFNYPNKQSSDDNTTGKTAAGTDYYFTYGNTLFISIDTNNYNVATHENVIKEATEKNPSVTWKIVMFHQDIYGSGYDHSDSDGMVLRTQLTPVIDKYDIDAVLQGHDHTYSRTYQLSSDGKDHSTYTKAPSESDAFSKYLSDNLCYSLKSGSKNVNKVVDPEGTVYFEANSATGSKFYQLIGTQQDYIAARCQSWRPTYSVIDITETTLTVSTYDAATNGKLVADGGIDTTYTIVKQADKSALESEIAKAETALEDAKNGGNTTEKSLSELSDVISQAKDIYSKDESTSNDIASAVVALQEAVKGLEAISSAVEDTKAAVSDDADAVSAATFEKGAVVKTEDGSLVNSSNISVSVKKLGSDMLTKVQAALKNNETVKNLDNIDYYDISLLTQEGNVCRLESGKVQVTFKIKDGIDLNKYSVRVFHYNETEQKVEELQVNLTDAGAVVEAESFSPFAVYYEVKGNVQTGDSALPMIMWFALAGCSLAGLSVLVITGRKRKAE